MVFSIKVKKFSSNSRRLFQSRHGLFQPQAVSKQAWPVSKVVDVGSGGTAFCLIEAATGCFGGLTCFAYEV
jgi:hypothetical protein